MLLHLTLVTMDIIKKIDNKCWRGCWKKGTLLHCWWECKLVQPLWRTVWRLLKKLKIELSYDPAIPLLGIYPEKTIVWKDTCTPMFIAALFTIARTQKQPRCPSTDFKAQHSENEDHGIQSHHFMANRWGNSGNSGRLYFSGLQNHCRWWLQPWN